MDDKSPDDKLAEILRADRIGMDKLCEYFRILVKWDAELQKSQTS
jgi:hypothetical protein